MFDVIVIGGGHAGCEAIVAALRFGCHATLITPDQHKVADLSWLPRLGGIGKKIDLLHELHQVGGMQPYVGDRSAVRIHRVAGRVRWQIDYQRYTHTMQQMLAKAHVPIIEDVVLELEPHYYGFNVITAQHETLQAHAVILAVGTHLRRIDMRGPERTQTEASTTLYESLSHVGFTWQLMKNGSGPVVDARTVESDKVELHHGEYKDLPSFAPTHAPSEDIQDWYGLPILYAAHRTHLPALLTFTRETTLQAWKHYAMTERSPVTNGEIHVPGVLHCPGFDRLLERGSGPLPVWMQPLRWDTPELYLSGMGTALPPHDQQRLLATMPGLEHARVIRYGYNFVYQAIRGPVLDTYLQVPDIPGLYLAGQINGTNGHEESAVQGFVAGYNAAMMLQNKPPFSPTNTPCIGDLLTAITKKRFQTPFALGIPDRSH